jgi:hypothetical protein
MASDFVFAVRRPSLRASVALATFAIAQLTAQLASPIAYAQPSSSDKETARALMKEGDEKFAAKDYAGALKAYQAAHDIVKAPTTSLALAKAQIERGLLLEARDTLLEAVRHPKEVGESVAAGKARDEASQLSSKIVDRIPALVITVDGAPAGTNIDVTIDGQSVPASTLSTPRKVNPGQHAITASAPGFQLVQTTVTLKEGEQGKASLTLKPGSSAPNAGVTQIHIESPDKSGNVFVDGRAVGATPLDVPVSAGNHRVEIQYAGGSHDERGVDVTQGQTATMRFSPALMDELARHRRNVKWGFGAGPGMLMFIEGGGGAPLYGGDLRGILNIGITPTFDFRTGLSALAGERGNAGATGTDITVTIPLLLGINYSPYFSAHAGLEGGFHLFRVEGAPFKAGGVIGPEWSVLTLATGEKRQYELGFWQGFRFGNLPYEYHQSVMLTYLML